MAGLRIHDSPAEQLHELARDARARGLTFEQFWAEACRFERVDSKREAIVRTNTRMAPNRAVRWPSDRKECNLWRAATRSAEEGWRRAYEQAAPSESERALTLLGPLFRRLEGEAPADGMTAQAAVA